MLESDSNRIGDEPKLLFAPDQDEGSPVVGVRITGEDVFLGELEGLGFGVALSPVGIELDEKFHGGLVTHAPEAGDEGRSTGVEEGAAETNESLGGAQLSQGSLAGA